MLLTLMYSNEAQNIIEQTLIHKSTCRSNAQKNQVTPKNHAAPAHAVSVGVSVSVAGTTSTASLATVAPSA